MKMKTVLGAVLMVLWVCPLPGQNILLREGDSYTQSFSSLSLAEIQQSALSYCQVTLRFAHNLFDPGEVLLVRMYEDSLTERPEINYMVGESSPHAVVSSFVQSPIIDSFPCWSDRQGIVRVEMLEGSVALDGLSFFVNDASEFEAFQGVTSVPEISSAWYLLAGLISGLLVKLRKIAAR